MYWKGYFSIKAHIYLLVIHCIAVLGGFGGMPPRILEGVKVASEAILRYYKNMYWKGLLGGSGDMPPRNFLNFRRC